MLINRIRKRWALVLAVAAAQAVVGLIAAVWLVNWLTITSEDVQSLSSDAAVRNAQHAALNEFIGSVRTIAVVLTAFVVLFSTALTSAILMRYEHRLASINRNLQELIEVRSRALLKSRIAVIFGLAKLAESRDDQTGQHLERIRQYVSILARELSRTRDDIDDEFIETLADTSSLHDIGKVGIPDAILLTPNRLTEEQRLIIQRHPLIGGDTLLAIRRVWGDDPFLITACEIVFAHHEHWDGTGYPFGLEGENIPISARIVAVADVYDALTSKRVYKDAMGHAEALAIIRSGSGTHFDPAMVAALERTEAEFERVSLASASDQRPFGASLLTAR